ncbi:putative RNA polymerase II subunit B1 CTD phosphatase RPAP2 isoform X3 [Hemicordylus capensis]|uniref:putative RNA polymerase II subunit B1 CTD phosphatase RPAP2 isoform X3 n=1 Tax=Hemicordylus capensis TaxID=884348 RepID=UPI00230449D7|nr:putative RNA polymerase II subunit B1 CTD phosphatase RPAP2 isoform X3 [Hemicordylus capensis]
MEHSCNCKRLQRNPAHALHGGRKLHCPQWGRGRGLPMDSSSRYLPTVTRPLLPLLQQFALVYQAEPRGGELSFPASHWRGTGTGCLLRPPGNTYLPDCCSSSRISPRLPLWPHRSGHHPKLRLSTNSAAAGERSEGKRLLIMAEEKPRSTAKARCRRKRAGNKQTSALKNENAAQRKAALEAAITKKIEYERRALHIVERLLEDDITEEFLVDCGKLITQSHYKDAVEERFIIKLCGYPICQNKLQNVPRQSYRISTKTNKVYDITERKCFCSDFCYRASKYFEAQISKSPVWLQEEERPANIQLLREGESGCSGKEVKLIDEAIKVSDVENPIPAAIQHDSGTESESSSDTEQEFVSSILQETLSCAQKLAQPVPRKSILKKKYVERAQPKPSSTEDPVIDAAEQLTKCKLDAQEEKHILGNSQTKKPNTFPNTLIPKTVQTSEDCGDNFSGSQVVFLGVSKKGAEQFKGLLAKSKQPLKHRLKGPVDPLATKSNLLEELRQTFTEWRTEETLKFLCSSNFTATCTPQQTSLANCEEEELDEDDFDSGDDDVNKSASEKDAQNSLDQSLPFRDSGTATKPLPSYEKLKEETSQLGLRVKEFYEAKFTLAEEDVMTDLGTEQDHGNDKDDQQWAPGFPLVDSNAQQQIRKRIVLEKLQKVLPAVLGPLQIPLADVLSDLKNLVKTFRLSRTIPIFASSQQSQVYTQFLATLLEELHFKHEDFESLTRAFRSD